MKGRMKAKLSSAFISLLVMVFSLNYGWADRIDDPINMGQDINEKWEFNCPRLSIPPIIDGKIEKGEWTSMNSKLVTHLIHHPENWQGNSDLSISFQIGWDEQRLYLVANVADDRIVQSWREAKLWKGDHLEIWVDVNIFEDVSETKINEDAFQIGISPGDFQKIKPEIYCWYPKGKQGKIEGAEVVSSRTKSGYVLEAAILLQFFGLEPEKDKLIGFCMLVSDTDDESYPQKSMISSSNKYKFANPTTFNRLHFEKEKLYSIIDEINSFYDGEQSYQIGTAEFKIFQPEEEGASGAYFEAYNKGRMIYTSDGTYRITYLLAFRYKDYQYISIGDWSGAAHGYGTEYIFSLDKNNNLKLIETFDIGPYDGIGSNLIEKNGKLYLQVDESLESFYNPYNISYGSQVHVKQYFSIENGDLIQSISDFKEDYLKEAQDYEKELENLYQEAKTWREDEEHFWSVEYWFPSLVGKIVNYLMAGEEEKAWENFEEYLTGFSLISQRLVTIDSDQTINPQKLKEDIISQGIFQ